MNPADIFEVYPIRELMLLFCLSALVRVHFLGQNEAKSASGNPSVGSEMKLKQGEKCNLTGFEKGSTLKLMFPPERIEAIKRKELRRYKDTQEKKWRNWLEAVSK